MGISCFQMKAVVPSVGKKRKARRYNYKVRLSGKRSSNNVDEQRSSGASVEDVDQLTNDVKLAGNQTNQVSEARWKLK